MGVSLGLPLGAQPSAHVAPSGLPRPSQRSEPGYPSLTEHLASRRTFLGWAGASLFTAVTSACAPLAGDGPNSLAYNRVRIPETGDLAVTLSGGGAARFYVNVACYSEVTFDYLADADGQDICRQALAAHTFAELSEAVAQGVGGPLHLALEEELRTAIVESSLLYGRCQSSPVVTLTIQSLTA